MQLSEIEELAHEAKRRWQDHGRLYSTALFEYSRWRQLPDEEKLKKKEDIEVRLKLLMEWFDKMDNHEPTILDKLNAKSDG